MSYIDTLEWVPTIYDGYESAWSPEDGCYLARSVHMPVMLHGDTREDAMRAVIETLGEWYECAMFAAYRRIEDLERDALRL